MIAPAHETVGHALPLWETSVTAERQASYHKYAVIDGALYGDRVDASVLSNDCLHGARPRIALGAKRLHSGVRIRQSAPLALGTPLTVAATVEALKPAKRGRYIHIDFAFQQPDGAVPIRIDHKSLILDPTPLPLNVTSKLPMPETGFEEVRRLQLTPELVSGYSFEFPHLEGHHDPEAAARIGMRAPIAQGLMGFTLLLAERMRMGVADRFDVEANFVRPIFWDEELTLEAKGDDQLRALNPARKIVSELKIHSWGD